jgi:hypothetical protein
MHPAQRGQREQRGRFHFDREESALRPTLVLALVRVVEEVAGDDRADSEGLISVLGNVYCLVDQLPARCRTVRLASDQM